ncbi:hypothetical protein [Fictibacillus phosphorivorans]|uniref:hypothetical protein n=1 Tax=Fictibacillus phosphorivorans TaxID=1221500 RepID=UPI0035F056D6
MKECGYSAPKGVPMFKENVDRKTVSIDLSELIENIFQIHEHVNFIEDTLYGIRPQECESELEDGFYEGIQGRVKKGIKETDKLIGKLVSIRNELA